MNTIETKICGIPCTVEYSIEPADKSVGIMSEGVEDWQIVALNGKTVKKQSHVNWLLKKMTHDDEQDLFADIMAEVKDMRDEALLERGLAARENREYY